MNKILDVLIIAAAAVAVFVAIIGSTVNTDEPNEMANDATTAVTVPTVLETTEPTQLPTEETEATQPPTEATEPPETTAETLPPETEAPIILYDVPLATELQLHIISEAESYGIDPAIIFAIAYRETTFNTSAIGDSGSSVGLMQVQPYWHGERMERLGCTDLLDPFQNVTVAIDYLDEMLSWYGGDMEKALTAYNRGHYDGTITEYARTVLAIAEELRGTTYESYKYNTGPQS